MSTALPCPVLVVCDDMPTRVAVAQALAEHDCQTIETADAEYALELLRSHDEIRSIVAASHQLGLMNGYDLARVAAARWPYVRHVVIVGARAPGPGELPAHATFLPRPLDVQALVLRLQQPAVA